MKEEMIHKTNKNQHSRTNVNQNLVLRENKNIKTRINIFHLKCQDETSTL